MRTYTRRRHRFIHTHNDYRIFYLKFQLIKKKLGVFVIRNSGRKEQKNNSLSVNETRPFVQFSLCNLDVPNLELATKIICLQFFDGSYSFTFFCGKTFEWEIGDPKFLVKYGLNKSCNKICDCFCSQSVKSMQRTLRGQCMVEEIMIEDVC